MICLPNLGERRVICSNFANINLCEIPVFGGDFVRIFIGEIAALAARIVYPHETSHYNTLYKANIVEFLIDFSILCG